MNSSIYLILLNSFYMKEYLPSNKHCLRSSYYMQIHTTGSNTSLKLPSPPPLCSHLTIFHDQHISTLAYKAKYAWPYFIFNSAIDNFKNLKCK